MTNFKDFRTKPAQDAPSQLFSVTTENAEYVKENIFPFTIIHTSDLHSHVFGFGPDAYENTKLGHFARLATVVKQFQQKYPNNLLTLDSGDWFAGTLLHMVSGSYLFKNMPPLELQLLHDLKYDATTIGNHEFDAEEKGFADIIERAQKAGIKIPILASNIFMDNKEKNCTSALKKHFRDPTMMESTKEKGTFLTPFVVKELKSTIEGQQKTLRVGLIGLYGPHSSKCSVTSRDCVSFVGYNDTAAKTKWDEYVDHVYTFQKKIRNENKVDVIVALAHSGTDEDVALLQSLEQLVKQKAKQGERTVDIHLSSHTHKLFLNVLDTSIAHEVGAYASNVGVLQLAFDFQKNKLILVNRDAPLRNSFYIDSMKPLTPFKSSLSVKDATLFHQLLPHRIPVNAHVPFDEQQLQILENYKKLVNDHILHKLPFKYDTNILTIEAKHDAKSDMVIEFMDIVQEQLCKHLYHSKQTGLNFPPTAALRGKSKKISSPTPTKYCSEDNLNSIDFYIQSEDRFRVDKALYTKHLGTHNTSINLQFSDIYRLLGTGSMNIDTLNADNLPGEPIAHFYITKQEVYDLIMAGQIYGHFDEVFALVYTSSLTWQERPLGIPFVNRIYDVRVHGKAIDDPNEFPSEYIHVAAPKLIAQYFLKIPQLTFGLFDIVLRDRFGRPLGHNIDRVLTPHQEFMLLATHK